MYVFLISIAVLVCGAIVTYTFETSGSRSGAAALTVAVVLVLGVFLYAGGGHRYAIFPRLER